MTADFAKGVVDADPSLYWTMVRASPEFARKWHLSNTDEAILWRRDKAQARDPRTSMVDRRNEPTLADVPNYIYHGSLEWNGRALDEFGYIDSSRRPFSQPVADVLDAVRDINATVARAIATFRALPSHIHVTDDRRVLTLQWGGPEVSLRYSSESDLRGPHGEIMYERVDRPHHNAFENNRGPYVGDYIEGEEDMHRLIDILSAQYGEARGLESRPRLVQFGPEVDFEVGDRVHVRAPSAGRPTVYGVGTVIGAVAAPTLFGADGRFMVRLDSGREIATLRPWLTKL